MLWKYLLSHHAQKHLAVPPFKPMLCGVSALQLSIDPPPFLGLPPACYATTLPSEHFRRWNVDAVVFESDGHHITLCVLARTEARGCLRKNAELWRGHSLHAQRARMSLSCACGCWHNYGIAYSLVNVEKTRRSFDLQFYWCSHHGGPMICLRL